MKFPWAAGLDRPLPTATVNIPFGDRNMYTRQGGSPGKRV